MTCGADCVVVPHLRRSCSPRTAACSNTAAARIRRNAARCRPALKYACSLTTKGMLSAIACRTRQPLYAACSATAALCICCREARACRPLQAACRLTAARCIALYLQQAAKQTSDFVLRSRAEGNVRPVLTHGNKQPASQVDVCTSTRPVCDICDVHGCSGVQACTGMRASIATLLTVAASGGPSTLPAPQQLLPWQQTAAAVPAACATATAWTWLPCASAACEPKKGITSDKQVCGVTNSEPLSLQTYPPDMPCTLSSFALKSTQ